MDYILLDQTQQPGKNGVTMHRLTFFCVDDQTIWEMTCDNTYDNFKRSGWDHVCGNEHSYGLYANLKRTKRFTREKVPIVSADSPAEIVIRFEDRQQALRIVEQLVNPAPNRFRELFNG